MNSNTNKFRLSPRLRWGVGREDHKINFLKITTGLFIILSAVLVTRAGYLLFSDSNTENQSQPQVLGAVDNAQTKTVYTEYKIKKGDTLFTISKEYNIEWTALATINDLKPPFNLQVGSTLKIPVK